MWLGDAAAKLHKNPGEDEVINTLSPITAVLENICCHATVVTVRKTEIINSTMNIRYNK